MMGGVKDRDNTIAPEMFLNCIALEKVDLTSVSPENPGIMGLRERCFMNCVSLKGLFASGYIAYRQQKGWALPKDCFVKYGTDALTNCINFAPPWNGVAFSQMDPDLEKSHQEWDEQQHYW